MYTNSPLQAIKFRSNRRYENCDPNASPSPSSGATPTVGTSMEMDASAESSNAEISVVGTSKEDSFETNNQVGLLTAMSFFLHFAYQLTKFFLHRLKAWMRQTLLSQMAVRHDRSIMHNH